MAKITDMREITINRYNGSDEAKSLWDSVVREARNANFLHFRDFMDYHSHRFTDFSLFACYNGKPIAVLPANISGSIVYSHQGLTYGGWLMTRRHCTGDVMLEVMDKSLEIMRQQGAKQLLYKPIPHIYKNYPADEDLYALFRHGAKAASCGLSSAIALQAKRIPFDSNAKRALAASRKAKIEVKRSHDVEAFHSMLSQVLMQRHSVAPVHSIDELTLLMQRFPHNIQLFMAFKEQRPVAGVVMFYGADVAHAQYIAANEEGRECGALAALFDTLIQYAEFDGFRYFDFGISTENGGLSLTDGLNRQKCGFGGRGVVYESFLINL